MATHRSVILSYAQVLNHECVVRWFGSNTKSHLSVKIDGIFVFLTFDTNRHSNNHLIHLFMLHYHQIRVRWFYDIVTYQNFFVYLHRQTYKI